MTQKKLLEVLALVEGVGDYSWRGVQSIVAEIAKGNVVENEKRWADRFKADNPIWYPLDLSKITTWSTYERCVSLFFTVVNGQLNLEVKIYDGDNFNGNRKGLKFSANLTMPKNYVKTLESTILYKLDRYVEDVYVAHLEAQKQLWMTNLKTEILKK